MAIEDRMQVMQQIQGRVGTHDCPACGRPTYCAIEAGKSASTCWCMHVERDTHPEVDVGAQCLCRRCLQGGDHE